MSEFDRISILNAARCLLEDRKFKNDVVLPLASREYIEAVDALNPLLLVISRGEINARGRFARVRVDHPIFYEEPNSSQLRRLSLKLRQSDQIILGNGAELEPSDIPNVSWWLEGVVWEKSILWVSNPEHFDEERRRRLKVEQTVETVPERPDEFEELTCFVDVTLSLDDVMRWAKSHGVNNSPKVGHNKGKAGAKPSEDWPKIEKFLMDEIETGTTWKSWNDVWFKLQGLLKDPEASNGSAQPYQKLTRHLKVHNSDLLEMLKQRIETVKTTL
ncbi:hypothetical protein [Pelagimonas varians]|uniref:Uncharacterized protein n=1 Tax=Pelagimonas varians TaxID=696760 RepID=A0A238KGV5_9RHOB|nr:hypothetical protein [Pelagimonas varians]PYG32287.1 hypothetical protein C8N36_10332 [Pelagimonas varians]SMX42011.1 hypothetical protein PEV8663_02398 [Pelagimonas varians]